MVYKKHLYKKKNETCDLCPQYIHDKCFCQIDLQYFDGSCHMIDTTKYQCHVEDSFYLHFLSSVK